MGRKYIKSVLDPRRMNYIGKKMKVKDSKNKAIIGIEGIIVDETKKSFRVLGKDGKIRRILKMDTKFIISDYEINGNEILKRPEERIKMKIKDVIKPKQEGIKI